MKENSTFKKILVCIFPFLCIPILYFSAQYVINNVQMPPCDVYAVLGIYCPGCGMTRAVTVLVNGDILLSLRQNAFVLITILIAVAFYIEFAIRAFGVNFKLPFHKEKYIYIILIVFALYTIARNFIPQIAPI